MDSDVHIEVAAQDLDMCDALGVPFDKQSFIYFLQEWYRKTGRPLQAVHPRDILKIVVSLCEYTGEAYHLTPALIDEACRSYFVDSDRATISKNRTTARMQ